MFFFSNQSSFVPFSTNQLCSPALCPSLTKAWIVFRAKFCTPASFGGNESPVRRTCRFEPEDITQHVTRCIYLSTYFSDVEMEFLVCTCHVRSICLFIYVYPKFFCWGFSPPTWAKKHYIVSLTLCARPSSIRASSASPTPKVDELPEGGIKGIECWGYLINISIYGQYFWIYFRKHIHGAINRQEQNQTAP